MSGRRTHSINNQMIYCFSTELILVVERHAEYEDNPLELFETATHLNASTKQTPFGIQRLIQSIQGLFCSSQYQGQATVLGNILNSFFVVKRYPISRSHSPQRTKVLQYAEY